MKIIKFLILAMLIVAIGIGIGYFFYSSSNDNKNNNSSLICTYNYYAEAFSANINIKLEMIFDEDSNIIKEINYLTQIYDNNSTYQSMKSFYANAEEVDGVATTTNHEDNELTLNFTQVKDYTKIDTTDLLIEYNELKENYLNMGYTCNNKID